MQLFTSPIRAVGVILALLVAVSAVFAMPPPIDVVAKDAAAPLNHDENNMLKRQDTTMLKRQDTSMLKRQENDMLKRQENDMLKRQETTTL
ncbi:hypothetical protein V8D89_014895 [Ganoderma adspersum]